MQKKLIVHRQTEIIFFGQKKKPDISARLQTTTRRPKLLTVRGGVDGNRLDGFYNARCNFVGVG